MRPKETKKSKMVPVLRAYTKAALRYPWLLIAAVVGTLGIELSAIIAPLYIKDLINLVAENDPSSEIVGLLLILLASYAGIVLFGWCMRRLQMFGVLLAEAKVSGNLTNEAFSYLIDHTYDFFINHFTGTLTRRVSRYARSFEQVYNTIFFNFLPAAAFSVGVIAVLFTRSAWLGIGMLVWSLVFLVIQVLLTRWRYAYKLERAAEDSRLTGALSDSIGNHSAVTLFAAQDGERKTIGDTVARWRIATMRTWGADQTNYGILGIFAIVIEVGLLGGTVYLWQQGIVTVGDFLLVQIYVLSAIERIWGLGSSLRHLYDAFAEAHEMIEIFEEPHAVMDKPGSRALEATPGTVTFNGVSFWFDPTRPVLSRLSLSIDHGEKVALVGPSGAGKTTITKLLLRLYDVQEGNVEIAGQDVRDVTQKSLREAIAFVPQEPALFHRTLHENIAYGRQDATRDEVIEAAKKAHCHEFISALPEGYDTYVGERGVKLSGGERQRVAIARAILKDAPILVLDEATSSLDSESEALIQDALTTLMEGKTVIVIAHRLSTIMRMDRIVVIETGMIAASGTHADLLNQEGGLYKKLWSIQAGSFAAED
jgi:ATP-binding cassette, subfamily B, bacterial